MSGANDPHEAIAGARRIAYRPGWRDTDPDELRRIHRELLDEPTWVIDGNYTNVDKAERIRRADLVVVLAPPRRTCIRRILRRQILNLGRGRPDMADGCVERFDADFLRFCWNWHRRHPAYGDEITGHAGSTPVIVLRSQHEANEFLERVARSDA